MHYFSSTVSTALRTHLTGNLQVFNNNSYITEVTRRGYKALNVCSIQPPNSDQTAAARGAHNTTSKQSFVLILNHYYIKILKKKISIKKWLLDLTFFLRYISAWCHHHQRFYSVIVKELFLFKQILKVTSGSKSCACTRIFCFSDQSQTNTQRKRITYMLFRNRDLPTALINHMSIWVKNSADFQHYVFVYFKPN